MSPQPTADRRCAVEGCHAWAMHGQQYCSTHYYQWQQSLALGVPDPEPRLVRGNRRLCQARACKHLAVPNSPYCATHARQYRDDAQSGEAIASAFASLLERLDSEAPDCVAVLDRELDLLTSARRILLAHAEMASRAGWKAISSMTFIRLWLSSAATVTDLAKARFVMENATGADFDRLLDGVYRRLDRGDVPAQQPLPLPPPSGTPPESPPLSGPPTPSSALPSPHPELHLAAWLLDANQSLGTAALVKALKAFAHEAHLPPEQAGQLLSLPGLLGARAVAQPLPPAQLGERLSALAQIMALEPDLAAVRTRLAAGAATHA